MPRRLILASQSPRRRELLSILAIPFEVVPSDAHETALAGESGIDFVQRVADEKGREVAGRIPDAVVLAADTIVSIDGEILGKPGDRDGAIRMLELLSGKDHIVYTAVSATDSASGLQCRGLEETRVWFRDLDRGMIEDYLERESVMDKAGAYAIQGYASVFIPRIEGNYQNVVGLPLPLTSDLLSRHGVT